MLGTDESLGGPGTPAVSAFAPEPFAAARIWGLVQTLDVEGWKAGKVAQATHALSKPAAAYVDAQPAPRLGSCGFGLIERIVAQAVARFHPELLAEREKRGRAGWHVKLTHPRPGDPDVNGTSGTSWLEVAGDTLDLSRFYAVVCDQAQARAYLGDTEELEVRKAKALGVIADAQATFDLHGLLDQDQEPAGDAAGAQAGPVRSRWRAGKVHLYLHACPSDPVTGAAGPEGRGGGPVDPERHHRPPHQLTRPGSTEPALSEVSRRSLALPPQPPRATLSSVVEEGALAG